MPELTTAPPTTMTPTYRPVSLMAIVGLIMGLLSLSVFLFDAFWLILFFPLPGFFISVLARRHIARSEGTLAGGMVAAMGIVLCVAGGLGYLTVYFTTSYFIRLESRQFIDRWTEFLRDGKEIEAFLCTVQPSNRPHPGAEVDVRSIRAHYPDGKGIGFDSFRGGLLPAMALRYGPKTEWTYQGLQDMQFANESYLVKHRYLLKTPEAELAVTILVQSETRNTEKGRRREWMIQMGASDAVPGTVKVSTYGMELRDAYKDAHKSLTEWVRAIAEGRPEKAYELLDAPDARKKAHFDELVKALRADITPGAPSPLNLRPPVQLQDDKEERAFKMKLRCVVESGPIDVEFDVRMETPDYFKGWGSWKIMDFTLLSVRQRKNPNDMLQAPPKPPTPPRIF